MHPGGGVGSGGYESNKFDGKKMRALLDTACWFAIDLEKNLLVKN